MQTLKTERLSLGAFEKQDAKTIVQTLNTKICARYMTAPFPYCESDAIKFIEETQNARSVGIAQNAETSQMPETAETAQTLQNAETSQTLQNLQNAESQQTAQISWAVRALENSDLFEKFGNQVLGCVTLRKSGTIGFWSTNISRGKGVIPEALNAVLSWASEMRKMQNAKSLGEPLPPFKIPKILEWDGGRVNISSARVAFKVGFSFEKFEKYESVTNFDLDLSRYLPYNDSRMVGKINVDSFPMTETEISKAQKTWPPIVKFAGGFASEMDLVLDGEIEKFSELGDSTNGLKAEKELLKNAGCSDFQTCVLLETAKIPRGETRTYSQIAQIVSKNSKQNLSILARAVGNALSKNPFPILIPCHRVVPSRKTGKLTPKTAGNYLLGKQAKIRLLEIEGAVEGDLNA